jgi:hypothetical protein
MYTLRVRNGSRAIIQTSDGKQIEPGDGWEADRLGDAWISTTQFGTVNFLDLGDTHIGGDSRETWGVLISYQGEETVGRYEGGGELGVTVNTYGQVTLSGLDFRQVALAPFIIE